MRYLYNTPITNLKNCGNCFIATLENKKQVLVDKLGRIISQEYKAIWDRPIDEYVEGEVDFKETHVLDYCGNILHNTKEKNPSDSVLTFSEEFDHIKYEKPTKDYESSLYTDDGVEIRLHYIAKEDRYFYAMHNESGVQISGEYDQINPQENGFWKASKNGRQMFLDKNGNVLGGRDFHHAESFGYFLAPVADYDETGELMFTFLKKDGTLFNNWYDYSEKDSCGYGIIRKRNRGYFITPSEVIVSKGYKNLSGFKEGIASFSPSKGKYTYLRQDFTRFDEDFDRCEDFNNGFGIIISNGVYDAINHNQIKLTEISYVTNQIQDNPSSILMLDKRLIADTQTYLLLASLAIHLLRKQLKTISDSLERDIINSTIRKTEKELKLPESENEKK